MDTDFIVQVKSTIFWLDRGLRVYLDCLRRIFQKVPLSTFLTSVHFQSKTPYFGSVLAESHPNHVKPNVATTTKMVINTVIILVWQSLNDEAAQNNSSNKYWIQKLHTIVKQLFPCFLTTFVKKKQVLGGSFWKIWRIQIQINP